MTPKHLSMLSKSMITDGPEDRQLFGFGDF